MKEEKRGSKFTSLQDQSNLISQITWLKVKLKLVNLKRGKLCIVKRFDMMTNCNSNHFPAESKYSWSH